MGLLKLFGLEKENEPNGLILYEGENSQDCFWLDCAKKNYTRYQGNRDTVYQYRFDGYQLFERVIELKIIYSLVGHICEIRDNVVMENDIRDLRQKHDSHMFQYKLDEWLDILKKYIEWSECKVNRIKYFILFRHFNAYPNIELRKYFRTEVERISTGYKKVQNNVVKFGFHISIDDGYCQIKGRDKQQWNDNIREFRKLFYDNDNFDSDYGMSYVEFEKYNSILLDLESYLKKLK